MSYAGVRIEQEQIRGVDFDARTVGRTSRSLRHPDGGTFGTRKPDRDIDHGSQGGVRHALSDFLLAMSDIGVGCRLGAKAVQSLSFERFAEARIEPLIGFQNERQLARHDGTATGSRKQA